MTKNSESEKNGVSEKTPKKLEKVKPAECNSTSEITETVEENVTKKEKKKKSKKKSKDSDSEILVEEEQTNKQQKEEILKTEEKSEVVVNDKKFRKKANKPSVDQVQDFKGSSFKKIKGYAV